MINRVLPALLLAWCSAATLRADDSPSAAALISRFKREKSAIWSDGDKATFFFQGEAETVQIIAGGDIKALERIPSSDVWTLEQTLPGLERAVISYSISTTTKRTPAKGAPTSPRKGIWRGPKASPPVSSVTELRGSLKTIELDSKALATRRKLTVYLPPGFEPGKATRAIYAADGEGAKGYAAVLEPLITSKQIPPSILVGVHSGGYLGGAGDFKQYDAKKDMRAQEYFPGINPQLFSKHETFFCSEVPTYAQREWRVSTEASDSALFGCSNGARFAFEMAMRHPAKFGHILAFSVPGAGEVALPPGLQTKARFHLVAGTWEPPFEAFTMRIAEALKRSRASAEFRSRVGGHDEAIWREEFAHALSRAFRAG